MLEATEVTRDMTDALVFRQVPTISVKSSYLQTGLNPVNPLKDSANHCSHTAIGSATRHEYTDN